MVRNLPSNSGDAGSIPGQGTKVPHATGQISQCAKLEKPSCLHCRAHVLRTPSCQATTREKPACSK